jgi:hypothetical protein
MNRKCNQKANDDDYQVLVVVQSTNIAFFAATKRKAHAIVAIGGDRDERKNRRMTSRQTNECQF